VDNRKVVHRIEDQLAAAAAAGLLDEDESDFVDEDSDFDPESDLAEDSDLLDSDLPESDLATVEDDESRLSVR
jgi:hypothetical protein